MILASLRQEQHRQCSRKSSIYDLTQLFRILYAALILVILHAPTPLKVFAQEEDGSGGQNVVILDYLLPLFDTAWETHPLFSTPYPDIFPRSEAAKPTKRCSLESNDDVGSCSSHTITTKRLEMVGTQTGIDMEKRLAMFRRIFNIRQINSLLHSLTKDPNTQHKRDYQVIKKITREDGTERNGMLPDEKLEVKTIYNAINRGNFSLIVNNMQRQIGTVASFSRKLQEETKCGYVSCNLYLTPPATDTHLKSGFEVHWDWMDVIVLQISGSKLWSVASEPAEYLCTPDQKRTMTPELLERYRQTRYDDFLLRPGDLLYIPRGFPHNASTIESRPQNGLLSESREPSLHLTFGIENGCISTMEMLLHSAVHLFVERTDAIIAIPRQSFNADNDLTWGAILHGAIMDVARNIPCDDTKTNPCELRKSVWNKNEETDKAFEPSFLLSLQAIRKHAKVQRTAAFVNTLQNNHDVSVYSCLPRILPSIDLLLCPPHVLTSLREDTMHQYIMKFLSFAKRNMVQALQQLKDRVQKERIQKWTKDDALLNLLGQSTKPAV